MIGGLQQTFLRLSRRLTGRQGNAVADGVLPVVVLGTDSADGEHGTYFDAVALGAGGAGFVGQCTLLATVGDVEVLAAWASNAVSALLLGVDVIQTAKADQLGRQPLALEAGADSHGEIAGAVVGGPNLTTLFRAPVDTTLYLPVAGVLERGRGLRLESQRVNAAVSIGFLWRNRQGLT